MPKVGLVCGPTGGHLLPACLVAEALREHSAEPCLFTTMKDELDNLLDGTIPLTNLDVKPWAGSGLTGKVSSLFSIGREYLRLRHRFRSQDAIISFGGHTAVPVLLAARELGIPFFIQEQNTIMGRANRLFYGSSQTVFYGLPPRSQIGDRGVLCGNPVRPPQAPPEEWFEREPLLVVFGGSQGSRELSGLLGKAAPRLLEQDWSIFYVKGEYGRDLREHEWATSERFRQTDFVSDFNAILPAAQLLWSRAGAGTITEIIYYDLPAILFPYRYAADNHQYYNAQWLSGVGPARIIDGDRRVSAEELLEATRNLLGETGSYDIPWERDPLPQETIARLTLSRVSG